MPRAHRGKPAHLAAGYAEQFGDEAVAAAYQHRPPYPDETFVMVERLLGPRPRRVVELGAGTGDFTIGLAPLVDRLVAVEPSRPMLERARRVGAHVEWLAMSAEDLVFDEPYSAVVAVEAFHWLDWERVVPRIAAGLVDGGRLILVQRGLAQPLPWEPELRSLISEYSRARLDAGRARSSTTRSGRWSEALSAGTVQLPVEARLVWMRPVAS